MLHLGHPAVAECLLERRVFLVLDVELLVLLAVVNDRTTERVALDVEHRAFLRVHMAHELQVRGGLPIAAGGVLHVVDDVEAVLARFEDVRLHHGDALPVRPRERHAEFFRAGRQPVFGRWGREVREMRGFGTPIGDAQPGAHDAERRIVGREQAHGRTARLLVFRILHEIGAQQVAALQAQIHVDHVGDDTHRRRIGCGARCSRDGSG